MDSPHGLSPDRLSSVSYLINKICYLVQHDAEFREGTRHDPDAALADWPLPADVRAAFLAGDVATLYRRGAHPVLLVRLVSHQVFGLDVESYVRLMHTCRRSPPDGLGWTAS